MLVKVVVKSRAHPDENGPGSQKGDIVYFWPMDSDHGDLVLRSHMVFVTDAVIPCGENFNNQPTNCKACPTNEIDECDVSKYTRGLWSPGDVLVPPVLLKKRKYSIKIDDYVSGETLVIIDKEEKTKEEKDKLLLDAKNNPVDKSAVKDKDLK